MQSRYRHALDVDEGKEKKWRRSRNWNYDDGIYATRDREYRRVALRGDAT